MVKQEINGAIIECIQGDISNQPDIDAIVNAANAELRRGGGVAGAIHRAAGAGLEQECRQHAPIHPGQAVITRAYSLPNRYVIHCLGPVYGVDQPADELLADCYLNALHLAEQHCLQSIAFPAISTGAFGYPTEAAARVALKTILKKSAKLSSIKLIRFVLFQNADLNQYAAILTELINTH